MIQLELAEILDKMFAIGGNHNTEKAFEIRNNLLDLHSIEDVLLKPYDANIIMTKDAINFLDASAIHAQTTDTVRANAYMAPFFERLLQSDEWNYYEIKLLVSSMYLTESIEQALELCSKAVKRIVDFQIVDSMDILEGGLACNMCARLLYAKYFENNTKIDLANEFETQLHKLKQLEDANYKLVIPLRITKIRQAVFNQDQELIDELIEKLDEDYGDYNDITNIVKNGVHFYITSEKYNELLGGEK